MKKQLFLFLLFLLPLTASADESGTCGDNLTWTYVEATQTLTISGSGDMYNYSQNNLRPWKNNDINTVIIEPGVTSIGNFAFSSCKSLTSISIPNSVTSIGYYAFEYCYGLTSIFIPNSVTSIGRYAFSECSSLTSIGIPNSMTNIGDYTFSGMTGLTSITIPNNVTSIGESAFSSCYNLTSINISSSVQNIGEKAFYGCPRLHTIYCLNPIPPNCHGTQTFASYNVRSQYDIYDYAVLHVPMGSKEIYGSAYEWRYFEKVKEDMQLDGNIYYANLTVQQGTTGYTRQAIKAGETYTIYIGSFGDNRVNAVTFNGVDVTEEIVNGNYTTPEITGESVLCISYEIPSSAPSLKLNNVKVMGYNGEITISNIDEPSDISIYSADGKIVNNIPSASGTAKISVTPDQLYVVKVGSRTYKIAL